MAGNAGEGASLGELARPSQFRLRRGLLEAAVAQRASLFCRLPARLAVCAIAGLTAVLAAGVSHVPAAIASAPPQPPSVSDLTTEHLVDPLGIDTPHPRLGWVMTSRERGVDQTAYQIVVAASAAGLTGDNGQVWNSGKVSTAQSFDLPYSGPSLPSRTRYFWKVRVWDNHGRVSAWSRRAWFETAYLDPSAWRGDWIGKDTSPPSGFNITPASGGEVSEQATPEPLFRKTFVVNAHADGARVYVSGLGYYVLYVNGTRVGNHMLDPGFTAYDHTVLYATYDVTSLLQPGKNVVAVRLGRGFYATTSYTTTPWHSEPKLKLELDWRSGNGETGRIATDNTWKVTDGPVTADDLQGETYDARLEKPGWNQLGCDESSWSQALVVPAPQGQLRAQMLPPITASTALTPVSSSEPAPGDVVYDFGPVTAGWARITVQGKPGTTVTLTYAEKLNSDGTAESENNQTDTYILKGGGPETFEPDYGYKGYRYIMVSASPSLPAILSIRGIVVHSDVPKAGDFSSSSDLFNRMHRAEQRTILNNLDSIPTDTPVYEKKGWTGDAQAYGEAAIRNFGMESFFEKWLNDFTDAQKADGEIPVVVPAILPTPDSLYIDPVWSGAVVFIHTYLYRYYGDTAVLRRDYETMKKWMEFYESYIKPTNYIYYGFTFGDWVFPTNEVPPAVPPGPSLVATAFLFRAAQEMAEIASVVGNTNDAQHYAALAADIKSAFNSRYYDPVDQSYGDTPGSVSQGSDVLALAFDLVPTEDRDAVVASLAHDLALYDNHLSTGEMSAKYLLPVLTDGGDGELAYKIATNPTYPGWANWFLNYGATTMWEEWESSARSHDHAMFGTIDDWFYTRLAGIIPTSPAFRTISVKPYPVGGLAHASAWEQTPLGVVKSSWARGSGTFGLTVTIPVGATAHVFVPARDATSVRESGAPVAEDQGVTVVGMQGSYLELEVGSGRYAFQSETY